MVAKSRMDIAGCILVERRTLNLCPNALLPGLSQPALASRELPYPFFQCANPSIDGPPDVRLPRQVTQTRPNERIRRRPRFDGGAAAGGHRYARDGSNPLLRERAVEILRQFGCADIFDADPLGILRAGWPGPPPAWSASRPPRRRDLRRPERRQDRADQTRHSDALASRFVLNNVHSYAHRSVAHQVRPHEQVRRRGAWRHMARPPLVHVRIQSHLGNRAAGQRAPMGFLRRDRGPECADRYRLNRWA
jgi:hypothetical protein